MKKETHAMNAFIMENHGKKDLNKKIQPCSDMKHQFRTPGLWRLI